MDNNQLLQRIEELEKWKAEKERQQIKFPLDITSQQVLANYFMQITGSVASAITGASSRYFLEYLGKQGPYNFSVSQNTYVPYTVNTGTNIFTAQTEFYENTEVYVAFTQGGVPPSPLTEGTPYYVVNTTGNSFKLSATLGGASINITDTGTGTQYLYYF